MKLVNGINKPVAFRQEDIRREASQDDGLTSIVVATCDDGNEVSISQHGSGDWDISVNGDPADSYDAEDGDIAVKEFIRLVQEYNG